jgi:UDP-N-acetylglucosamine acyltransferase
METQETTVHPTAVVLPGAELGSGVEVGPYCIIEPGVEVGDGCKLSPHVHLLGKTTIGTNGRIGSGSVVGGEPQDKAYRGEPTQVIIGADCRLHEHVTIHRATKEGSTVLGNDVMMMAGAHVGHNAIIENGVIMVNNSSVGGYAMIGEHAFLSQGSAVHQFGKIGRLTLLGGCCMATKDVPPFSIAVGSYPVRWRAPNSVGLKRSGFSAEERSAIRKALFAMFKHSDGPLAAAEDLVYSSLPPVAELARFVMDSPRGLCAGPAKH